MLNIFIVFIIIGNLIKGDVGVEISTESGLKYVDEKIGEGEFPEKGSLLVVHYIGTLENGTKFDSSHDRNQPFEFPLGMGRVIKGWDEGFSTMKVGGKRKLIIPSELGYGSRGAGKIIPPNTTLIFDVELLEIKPGKPGFVDTDFSLPGKEINYKSGLKTIIHKEGNGDTPLLGQVVVVHYKGLLNDGTEFDNSHSRGSPISFPIGQGYVIKGWDEGLSEMRVGEKRTFIIPPELGYGSRGKGPIPPNSTLIFEVELVGIEKPEDKHDHSDPNHTH